MCGNLTQKQNKTTLTILIDFDNYFNKINLLEVTVESFANDLRDIISIILKEQINLEEIGEIKIRLYSGWYKDNELTNKASNILSKIASLDIFPIFFREKHHKITGTIEIATSIYFAKDLIFHNTYQEKPGIPRLRIKQELLTQTCHNNRARCPIYLLNKFTKKKTKLCPVESCSYLQNDVFVSNVQKMIDTMIACDIIEFSERRNVVFLLSDDIDHIPALIQSSKYRNIIYVGIRNPRRISSYNYILERFGIKTILV